MSSEGYDDYPDVDDPYDGINDDTWDTQVVRVGIARVPIVLLKEPRIFLDHCKAEFWHGTMCGGLPRAWMHAVADTFPDMSLSKLRSRSSSLLPAWLLEADSTYQVLPDIRYCLLDIGAVIRMVLGCVGRSTLCPQVYPCYSYNYFQCEYNLT
jgi:hypothetical protein